ncbi:MULTISPECIES: lipid asymmetry maintenance protein MlaB [Limnohabitans]|jgi:phospholipid transport system transporter-binding protein|nr:MULTISPECIES: STAS domain-containing protein [Limnohabitans]
MNTLTAAIALPAVLMQAQAQAVADGLVASLTAQLAEGGEAVLDASALTQFDSSALAVILACRRAVLGKGAQLRVTGLPDRAQALAKVYGLSALLH